MTESKTVAGEVRREESGGRQSSYMPDRLVVKLKSKFCTNPDAQQLLMQTLPQHSNFEHGFDRLGIAVVNLPPGADPVKIAQEVGNHDMVEFAEPDYLDSGASE